ncbi:MAG: peptidylprolyl isomerase [Chromatiales bacterium]|nr:peptidylprolyl isomerase [Chromatiales bacterium]
MKRLFLIAALALAFTGLSKAAVEPLDRILVIVNEDVITTNEFFTEARRIMTQLRQQGTRLPPPEVFQRQVLERMILQRIQLQLAKQTGLEVDDSTLNETLRKVARRNNMSLIKFSQVLERDGVSFEQFREQIRDEMTLQRLQRREVENRITVSDQEVDNFLQYEAQQLGNSDKQYRLQHILVALPEAPSSDQIASASEKAKGLVDKLRNGSDFQETAVAESDAANALEGGDLGMRTLGQMPTIFLGTVQDMAVGEISDPIRSPAGFHIVKLAETSGSDKRMVTQTEVRHILIRPDEMTAESDALTRLSQLKTRIEGGEDFGALARAHSDDKGSAIKGGDLGWVSPGVMVPEFEQVMKDTLPGEVSSPFQTPFGWHILQVVNRRDHDSTEELRRNEAREQIAKRKSDEELDLWYRRLRDEAYVEFRTEDR